MTSPTTVLKDKFTQKWDLCTYLLTPMLIESQVKFRSPYTISGASSESPEQLK